MEDILGDIAGRVLLVDGAMGTMLQGSGLRPGACPEELNASDPDAVIRVHIEYVKAGADILTTNSFGGTRVKLAEYGLEGRVAELNAKAVDAAKKAASAAGAGRRVYVAGGMGPTGRFLAPVGDMSFDVAFDMYFEQAKALASAGADLLLIETMSDIKEARAAVIAAKAASKLPVAVTMTFQQDLRSLLGTPPEVAVCVLTAAGADVVGANCSLGPEGLIEVAKVMARHSRVPLLFQPNAGLPKLVDGKTVFPAGPEVLAEYAGKFIALGAGLIGSCCGSTPAHTKAMAEVVGRDAPGTVLLPSPPAGEGRVGATRLASRTRLVSIGSGCLPAIIGERINPTGRKDLTAELSEGRMSLVKKDAKGQAEAGAALIDINVGLPGGDEAKLMPMVVRAVEESTDLPIVIDSTDPAAIEAALKETGGKPLVNSVTGDKERLEALLPLVKKYGAAVVGLTIDESGVPDTAEKRVVIAKRILAACEGYGIPKEDLVIDALVLTASAEQAQAVETLKAVRMLSDMGLATSLGVSNISFGLPNRPVINSTYLVMALGHGLDAAMVNPYDARMGEAMSAGAVLMGRDLRAEKYIALHKKVHRKEEIIIPGKIVIKDERRTLRSPAAIRIEGDIAEYEYRGEVNLPVEGYVSTSKARQLINIYEKIYDSIIQGDKENIVSLINLALKENMDPLAISNECLIPALTEVGKLYEAKEFFLPQVMQSAETMKAAFARLKQEMKGEAAGSNGTVVLATVFGDVHDIGKNILSTLLENHGIRVVDLGKNVPKEAILDAAVKENADVIGLSALMTTTMTQMDAVIKERDRRGLKIPVVIGGAVVTEQYAQSIGAAGCSRDALEAVELIKGVIKKCL